MLSAPGEVTQSLLFWGLATLRHSRNFLIGYQTRIILYNVFREHGDRKIRKDQSEDEKDEKSRNLYIPSNVHYSQEELGDGENWRVEGNSIGISSVCVSAM